MGRTKLTIIGAGSFVFGTTVLRDAIVRQRLAPCELALVDLDRDAAETMAQLGCRMVTDTGIDCAPWATDDRREALPGSDFVVLCAAVEGARRWRIDRDILAAAGMSEQARECGGLGGLSYALRSISLALDVCADMEVLCPGARLLTVTNPLPRVIAAVHRFTRVPVFGFCNESWGGPRGYARFARMLDRDLSELEVVTAGLNHLTWLVSLRARATGQNLYPTVVALAGAGEGTEYALLRRWLEDYGALAATSAGHLAEFLPPDPLVRVVTEPPFHGTAEERRALRDLLRAAGRGEVDWRRVLPAGSWEHPVDIAAALVRGEELAVDMLNVPNEGYLQEIPAGHIVQVPAEIRAGGVRGVPLPPLPGRTGALCAAVSEVHELVAAGAATGNRAPLVAAIEHDPAIPGKQDAVRVLDELLAAHADVLPRFADSL